MLVTYLRSNEQVMSIMMGFPRVWEENNQLLIEGGQCPVLNNLTQTGWGYYKDTTIPRKYAEGDVDTELPLYLADLTLEPIDADDLPHSEHIGKLIAVNPALAKPATVRRKYLGVNYDIQCLVSQAIVNMWTATPKEVDIDDYVLVSFIEEIPDTEEKHIAIVTDKVFKNW